MTDLLTILIQMPLKYKINFENKVFTAALCSPRQKDEMQDACARAGCFCFLFLNNHFTVVCLVARPLNDSEAEVDFVLIETSLLSLCKFP